MSTTSAKPDPLLQPDEARDHIRGPASAPVTVIEYGDFECPVCRLDDQHILGCATRLGLDPSRYGKEMRDHVFLQRVQHDLQAGRRLGVHSTPAFFVNGVFADVSFGMQHLHEAIDKALPSA